MGLVGLICMYACIIFDKKQLYSHHSPLVRQLLLYRSTLPTLATLALMRIVLVLVLVPIQPPMMETVLCCDLPYRLIYQALCYLPLQIFHLVLCLQTNCLIVASPTQVCTSYKMHIILFNKLFSLDELVLGTQENANLYVNQTLTRWISIRAHILYVLVLYACRFEVLPITSLQSQLLACKNT